MRALANIDRGGREGFGLLKDQSFVHSNQRHHFGLIFIFFIVTTSHFCSTKKEKNDKRRRKLKKEKLSKKKKKVCGRRGGGKGKGEGGKGKKKRKRDSNEKKKKKERKASPTHTLHSDRRVGLRRIASQSLFLIFRILMGFILGSDFGRYCMCFLCDGFRRLCDGFFLDS